MASRTIATQERTRTKPRTRGTKAVHHHALRVDGAPEKRRYVPSPSGLSPALPFMRDGKSWNPEECKLPQDAGVLGRHHAAHLIQYLADNSCHGEVLPSLALELREGKGISTDQRTQLIGFFAFIEHVLGRWARSNDVFAVLEEQVLLARAVDVADDEQRISALRKESAAVRYGMTEQEAQAIIARLL